ncbi:MULTISPECIES: helix-turn-helix domain-containing protein [Bradyrhizobium]|uniref:helix-turn-helix domain-containing protein n=1 Tax=Bradyrhizobium TaxID=374 RepID=UPI0010089E02|nr:MULTISPECIES: XRE family transcriptional regulator [Bradyrhizobium]MDA9399207.1 transcriptional regulator [Bradyrhizobium sp. CCBAU 45389]MDA9528989.1 transcriptional regulator [Bradyrhizobium sp. CCBAU 25338]RXH33612.1 transcriptional regulator [Bradyrhizobium nanningense]
MIGNKLKVARSASGLSLRGLSDAIDGIVSAQAIGKYERNEDMPSSRVLIALAKALGVTEEYLLNEDEIALEGVDFRKKVGASSKEEAVLEARAIHMLERYLAVEDLLQMRSIDWEQPRSAPHPVADLRDAEDAARSVREDWGLGNDPIPQLAELLEERGIKIFSFDLDDIDGLAAKVRRKDRAAARVIVIKRSTWSERKRFNLAHELGHMVIAPSGGIDEEKAAHRFAGAFLVPADVLRAEIGAHRSSISIGELVALKKRFGVSIQALVYRCKDLGIISQAAFARLFKIFAERGWRTAPFQEPETMEPELEEPKRFERLCYRALAEGMIGESRAAELLGISVRELDARLDQVAA